MIIAIEGGDGSGKRTTARALQATLTEKGSSVAGLAFPRYGETAASQIIADYLNGRLKMEQSPKSLAAYYALDRFESKHLLLDLASKNEFLILDRYIASNIAYQGAHARGSELRSMINWIYQLEIDLFELPPPDLSILLLSPVSLSASLVGQKPNREYTSLSFDRLEADELLQAKVREIYSLLAAESVLSPWLSVAISDGAGLRAPEAIVSDILAHIERLGSGNQT